MTNSRAGGGILQQLATKTLTGTSSTITVTPTVDMTKYSKLILVYKLISTATLTSHFTWNGITTGYYSDRLPLPSKTVVSQSNIAYFPTQSCATGSELDGTMDIFSSVTNYGNIIGSDSIQASGLPNWYNATAVTDISEQFTAFLFTTSTSTYAVGSTITLYGLKKQ